MCSCDRYKIESRGSVLGASREPEILTDGDAGALVAADESSVRGLILVGASVGQELWPAVGFRAVAGHAARAVNRACSPVRTSGPTGRRSQISDAP